MKIAILQFAPRLGERNENINRADYILQRAESVGSMRGVDLLVLPELAFSGYNFQSLEAIKPFLEDTARGPSTRWAQEVAQRLDCFVCIGYPEVADRQAGINYNSQVMVDRSGQVVKHHRKAHLYYTDENWATEGGEGWQVTHHPELEFPAVASGICMDINPYKFAAPWKAFEFANFCINSGARLVVLSLAWLSEMTEEELLTEGHEADMGTIVYWAKRFEPLIRAEPEDEVHVVFANRCGFEPGDKDSFLSRNDRGEVAYAGTSCVIRFDSTGPTLYTEIAGRNQEGMFITYTG